nr:hypothetical protein BaRGS_020315 [Batillaria attramentaria]
MTLWTLSALKGSSSFSTGAPDFLCKSMKPLHDAAGQPHDALPFTVTGDRATVPPGGVVTVTIAKRPEFARFPLRFQGILAVASDANGDVVSGMVTPPVTSGLKRQDCK